MNTIPTAQIGRAAPPPVENQELMLQQNGLGDDGPDASGPSDSENGYERVEKENDGIAHGIDRIRHPSRAVSA
jgi:hypothetical protein